MAVFPLGTFHNLHPEDKDMWVSVKYDDGKNKALVQEEIRELLRIRRKVRVDKPDDFEIFGPDSLSKLWDQVTSGLVIFMIAVSSVGLMVGGVGVMNIMLVSVTERTREIGVRKAIGATKRTILTQFTTEAVTLCVLGGIVGVLERRDRHVDCVFPSNRVALPHFPVHGCWSAWELPVQLGCCSAFIQRGKPRTWTRLRAAAYE